MVNRQVRFLILRGGAIGDFILTLPALQALREQWPDAYIELVGYPHIARLALAGGLADQVTSLNAAQIARFFSVRPEFPAEQVAYIRSFDIIVSYLHDPDGTVQDNLLRAGARQVIYGSPMVERGHAIDHLMKPLETLAIYCGDETSRLRLDEKIVAEGRALLNELHLTGRPVALHPGSGNPKKNWPLDCYVKLGQRLGESASMSPFFILGEADDAIAKAFRQNLNKIPVMSDRELLQIASVLANCISFVGNDSGITHLAGALGIPTVAIFGASNSERWGPRGPNIRIVKAPRGDISAVQVEDVMALLP